MIQNKPFTKDRNYIFYSWLALGGCISFPKLCTLSVLLIFNQKGFDFACLCPSNYINVCFILWSWVFTLEKYLFTHGYGDEICAAFLLLFEFHLCPLLQWRRASEILMGVLAILVKVKANFFFTHDIEARIMAAYFENILCTEGQCWLDLKFDFPFLWALRYCCEDLTTDNGMLIHLLKNGSPSRWEQNIELQNYIPLTQKLVQQWISGIFQAIEGWISIYPKSDIPRT